MPRDLPKVDSYVQWRVENEEEVARFLEPFMCRMKAIPGHQLLIQGAFTGMEIQVSPGDVLCLKDGQLAPGGVLTGDRGDGHQHGNQKNPVHP